MSILVLTADGILLWVLCRAMEFSAAQKSLEWGLLFWVYLLGGFLQGAYYNFCYLELPMAVEYGVWKFGYNQSGFIYSLNGFTLTAGSAIGTAVVGFCLGTIGYTEGVALTDSLKSGLLFIGLMAPSILCAVHAGIQCFFGISDTKYAEIQAANAAKAAKHSDN